MDSFYAGAVLSDDEQYIIIVRGSDSDKIYVLDASNK